MEALGLALAGAGAGLLGAVLGIGGGIFLVPALVLFFGVPMVNAVATGLVAVIATSSAVGAANVDRGVANMRLGMVLEVATVAGAILGSLLAHRVDPRLLIGLFSAVLAGVTALLWRGPAVDREPPPHESQLGLLGGAYDDAAAGGRVSYRMRRLPAALGVSGAAGALSGLLGVGGGVFKVPALHLFCGVPMKAAAATSSFMIGVTAAASAVLYLGSGSLLTRPTALVVLGVLAGSALGAQVSARLKDESVRRLFAALTLVLAAQMLRKALDG